MDVGHDLKVGPMVCFESAFPDMSRHLAEDGAQVLIAQSATSSFQNSWAPNSTPRSPPCAPPRRAAPWSTRP